MAYQKKVWKNRQSEHPNRRTLTPTGNENEFEVARAEGLVMEDGDALSAENLNNLEGRVETGIIEATIYVYTGRLLVDGWTAGTDEQGTACWTQTVAATNRDGGPPLTASTQLFGPMDLPTGVRETDEVLAEVLRIVNDGKPTPGEGTVTCKVWELPEADAQIYWPGKTGGTT